MKIHELKTWPKYFIPVWNGHKTFEVRKNDRDFQVGDLLILREWDPETQDYTGWTLKCRVTYILDDPAYVKEGYVILGIETGKRGDTQ